MSPAGTAEQLFLFRAGGEECLRTLFDPWDRCCGEVVDLPYYFFAVQHPRGWVLVDCGAHPDLARDPAGRLGAQIEYSQPVMGAGDDVAHQLEVLGLGPDDVSDVVVTHLHYDHCGGLELLPDAAVHLQRREWEFANDPPVYQQLAYVAADWAHTPRWVLHDGAFDLFGDGAIRVVPTPGHSPGHQSVVVRLPDGVAVLVGDAAYHPKKMAERKLPAYLWNPDALIESWELLEELERREGAHLLFSHYPSPGDLPMAPEPWRPPAAAASSVSPPG